MMKKLVTLMLLLTLVTVAKAQTWQSQDTLKLKHFSTWAIAPYISTTQQYTDIGPISTSSKLGFGNSLKIGGKVAGCNPSIGVSNYGGINVKISCFTFNFLYNETASGIKSVVNLNRFSSKS